MNCKQQPNAYIDAIKKEQNDLVVQYMPALKAMALRLKERLPASIEISDLVSIGATEMVKLSRKYDKNQNDSFWGFVKKRVYGSMLDYLRSLDIVGRANRKLIKAIDKEINLYFSKHECEPDNEYLAQILGVDVEKIEDARNANEISYVLSFDDQMVMFNEMQTTEEIISKDDLIDRIKQILGEFDEREQLIMQLYYYEELSLAEISEILHITQSRISQIHKRLINKIRQKFGA